MKVRLYDMIKARTSDREDDWLPILVMHLMTEHTKNSDDWFKVFGIKPLAELDEQTLDLRVTVNGVEVKFESFVKELQRQYCNMLEGQAKEMMTARCNKLAELVEEAGRLINDEIEAEFPGRKVW